MEEKIIKWQKIGITSICLIFSLFIIITIIYASSYSILVSDDFTHGTRIGAFHVSLINYIKASIKYTIRVYNEWQGTYFAMFIQAFFSPINNFGMPQLRFMMILNSSLFFFSLVYFLWNVMKYLNKEYFYIKSILITVALLLICGYEAYPEIFYWYSGSTAYSIPLSLMFIAFSSFIKLNQKNNRHHYILAVLLGIMVMGGSLTVVGLSCYTVLLYCIYLYFLNKTIPLNNLIIFAIWLAFAIINVAAPGNFVRHNYMDATGLHPFIALNDSIIIVGERLHFFFEHFNIFILLLAIFCGIAIAKIGNIKYKLNIFMSILALLMPVITAFPIALGYSGSDYPNRCEFVIDIAIIFSYLYLTLVIGFIFYRLFENKIKEKLIINAIMVTLICIMWSILSFPNIKIIDISKQLLNGVHQQHYYEYKNFLKQLEGYENGTDVVLSSKEIPQYIDNLYNFYLSDESSNWLNIGIADYYGLKSIAMHNEE